MSRSNPQANGSQNPAVRWFDWNGEAGTVRYYDREAKRTVDVGADFSFVLLDQLGSVRGWHEPSKSGIYSNEVRDTRQESMLVKAFKGGTLAEGLYKDIKDRVNRVGGQFVANCYVAFKLDGVLSIGSMRFKGAALGAWMEFCKTHRDSLYMKGIRIHGYTEGKKGRIVFRVPILTLVELSDVSNRAALDLDKALQTFLETYLRRNTQERVTETAAQTADEPPPSDDEPPLSTYDDDPIPFAWLLPLVLPALGVLSLVA